MKVTIKDVAKEANVATSTVSRVLSNSPRISEETKKKVNEAIKKLNYTPNVVARGLANNRTRILAVVLPDGAEKMFSNPFFAQALKGISVCAQKENYYIMYGFKDECSSDGWIKQFTESNLVDGLCLFNAKDNDEDIEYLKKLKPQNLYGWSKCYIDRFIAQDLSKNKNTTQVVGLKFFNVYGPNEYHKKGQTSVMYKFYKELRDTHKIKLFKSYHTAYRDGEQQRDFVYVDDCVDVILWMLAHSSVKGLFNVGTGQARTFIDIANIINSHFDNIADIEFIEMPLALQRHYQYHTCADISKLRMVGYKNTFHTIEEGINKYINFLKQIN